MMDKKKQSLKEIFVEASEYYKRKDFKTAEIYCYKILSIDPNHFDSLSLLANIFAVSRNFSKSKELLEKAIKIQPENTTILNNLGTACRELGDIEKAMFFYQKVLSINSNHTNANYNLGLIFFGLKELKKAKEYLKKTVKIQPNYAFAHFSLGNLQKEFKELKKAKASYLKAIEIRPSLASAQNNLGLVFSEMGDSKAAIECYKKALEINPDHASAHSNLARIYTEIGEFEKAIKSHQVAIKLEPENLVHRFYLSELNKNFLNPEVKNKTEKILNNQKTHKINFVFGNFLLSRYSRDEKNYEKELDYLIKAHNHFFELNKDKFKLYVKYCFDDVLQISNFAKFENSKKNTDNKIFGEPYDMGALWLENGDTNPFKIHGEKSEKFTVYKEGAEMYAVYNGDQRTSQEEELWRIYDGATAAIVKTNKDIAPIEVVPYQDQRWFDTAHLIIGPWEMGKDFSNGTELYIQEGETPNFNLISQAITNGIMELSILHKKPIGNGIITCLNIDQAVVRSKTKGQEAANAALSVLKSF